MSWSVRKQEAAPVSDLVPPEDIERIVGIPRHPWRHYARAVSADQTVYILHILHSHECRDSTPDLRDCPFSLALDRGIDVPRWPKDEPVYVRIVDGRLVPSVEVL